MCISAATLPRPGAALAMNIKQQVRLEMRKRLSLILGLQSGKSHATDLCLPVASTVGFYRIGATLRHPNDLTHSTYAPPVCI